LAVGESHFFGDGGGGVEVEAALGVEVVGAQSAEEGGVGAVGIALPVEAV
jgi:hypothetical protein